MKSHWKTKNPTQYLESWALYIKQIPKFTGAKIRFNVEDIDSTNKIDIFIYLDVIEGLLHENYYFGPEFRLFMQINTFKIVAFNLSSGTNKL